MRIREERAPGLCIVTATETGINHERSGVDNQDAVTYITDGSDFAIAVSDGVGSCAMSAIGSQAAIDSICMAFRDIRHGADLHWDAEYLVTEMLHHWKLMLGGEAIDDCCATIKAAIKMGSRLILLSLGDGLLAATSGTSSVLAPSDESLFANQTHCLNSKSQPSDVWTKEVQLSPADSLAVVACTDGISNYLQEGREIELAREIEANISESELGDAIESLMSSVSGLSPDDRTIGVVKHEPENA